MAYRKPQRRAPNPRTIKKHSDIVHSTRISANFVGVPEKTATGYKVPGASCNQFEVYTEVFVAGCATNTMKHTKKHRAYRILAGAGILVKGEHDVTRLSQGMTVSVAPGDEYRIITVGDEDLTTVVIQPAKYEARLTDVDTVGVSVESSVLDMHTFGTFEDAEEARRPRRRLSGSKAKAQLAATPAARKAARAIEQGMDTPVRRDTQAVNIPPAKIVNGELVE